MLPEDAPVGERRICRFRAAEDAGCATSPRAHTWVFGRETRVWRWVLEGAGVFVHMAPQSQLVVPSWVGRQDLPRLQVPWEDIWAGIWAAGASGCQWRRWCAGKFRIQLPGEPALHCLSGNPRCG